MKVLILGAGASKPAGYPAANKLAAIEDDVKACKNSELISAWAQWLNTKASAPGALGLLLDDSNPEVMLSVLDLCRISSFTSFEKKIRPENRDESVSDALADGKVRDSYFTSAHHRWLDDADTARFRLLDCLIAYFDWLHYRDRMKPECRAYLSAELEKLNSGDFVITFNWDTLAERCLWESGRWSPVDGYGFIRDLRRADQFGYPPVCGRVAEPSEILVLKLHGSVGWYRRGFEVYLADDVLNNLVVAEEFTVCDLLARKRPGPDVDAVLAYPSFLKKLDVPAILDIWRKADAALRRADEIEIWGYSLRKVMLVQECCSIRCATGPDGMRLGFTLPVTPKHEIDGSLSFLAPQ